MGGFKDLMLLFAADPHGISVILSVIAAAQKHRLA